MPRVNSESVTLLTYTATITSASLRLRESRIVADLLLREISDIEWQHAICEADLLQISSIESAKKVSSLIRARLEPLGPKFWRFVRDGDQLTATHATLAGAIKHSRILGDFMDITLREQRALFATKLDLSNWTEYIEGCRGRDPDMPQWNESTLARLRSAVFLILAEAGYLQDTSSLILQNVFLDAQVSNGLKEQNEKYLLRCMGVME